jgi:hypothetical protein
MNRERHKPREPARTTAYWWFASYLQSQRDCVLQPRVARHELPWVMPVGSFNPNGVVASLAQPADPSVGQAFQPAGAPDFPVRVSDRATGKSPAPADRNVRPTRAVHDELRPPRTEAHRGPELQMGKRMEGKRMVGRTGFHSFALHSFANLVLWVHGKISPSPGSRVEPLNCSVGQAFQPAGAPDFPVRVSDWVTGKSPAPADRNVRPTRAVHDELRPPRTEAHRGPELQMGKRMEGKRMVGRPSFHSFALHSFANLVLWNFQPVTFNLVHSFN